MTTIKSRSPSRKLNHVESTCRPAMAKNRDCDTQACSNLLSKATPESPASDRFIPYGSTSLSHCSFRPPFQQTNSCLSSRSDILAGKWSPRGFKSFVGESMENCTFHGYTYHRPECLKSFDSSPLKGTNVEFLDLATQFLPTRRPVAAGRERCSFPLLRRSPADVGKSVVCSSHSPTGAQSILISSSASKGIHAESLLASRVCTLEELGCKNKLISVSEERDPTNSPKVGGQMDQRTR